MDIRISTVHGYIYRKKSTGNHMKYAEIVRDIANRKPGLGFLFYDTQFRMLRQSVALPWDRIHTEFWLMACTSFHQQPFPPSQQNSRSQQSFRQSASKPRRFLDNTCWRFNNRQCTFTKCSLPHVCGFCKGPPHAAFTCTYTSKDQAARGNNSTKSTTQKSSK